MNSVVLPCTRLVLLTLLATTQAGVAADASLYGILKSQQFIQSNANAPVALGANGFAFNSAVIMTSPGLVTNATILPPNAASVRTLLPDVTGNALRFEERFNTQAELDAAYPNGGLSGSYLMSLECLNDGTQGADLTFTLFGLPLAYPPSVRVSNFAAAQAIDHTVEFTLRWTASGQALDQIQVVIIDASSNAVYTSPAPFAAGALTGASNHIVLPAYTLPSNANLIGHLAIARPAVPNTAAYPGALGVAALIRDTEFPLQTRPAPVAPQVEIISGPAGDSPLRLRIVGPPNRFYRLQASRTLTNWNDILITNSATGTIEFVDPNSLVFSGRAYRAAIGRDQNP